MSVREDVLCANEASASQFGDKGSLALPPARRFAAYRSRLTTDAGRGNRGTVRRVHLLFSGLLPMRRLAIPISLAASFFAVPTYVSAQGPKPSAARENAEGDPSGAIRALGAAGYNDHSGRKPPPVTIPPLNMGPAERGGVPHGTAGGARR